MKLKTKFIAAVIPGALMAILLFAVPGVLSATAGDVLPLTGAYFPYRWGHEDALADPTKFQAADVDHR